MSKAVLLPCVLASGAFIFAGGSLFAQDRAVIDLLEKKGLITQAERESLLAGKFRSENSAVTVAGKETKKITLSGYVQGQYNFLHVRGGTLNPNPPDTNTFEVRRALLNITAQLDNGWGAYITFVSDPTYRSRDFLENAAITFNAENYGTATAGYRKVKFAMEEVCGANALPAIERSIVTNYFTTGSAGSTATIPDGRLGFANRHVGLYWDGKVGKEAPFEYGVALVNGYTDSIQYASEYNNDLSFWANAQQTVNFSKENTVTGGLNLGWSRSDNTAVAVGQDSQTIGWNPFIKAKFGNLSLLAEYIGAFVKNGRNATDADAIPMGTNLVAAYRIGDIEPVVRYCYLDTDGRGTPMAIWRWSSAADEGVYDKAQTLFVGMNFYAAADAIKISAGYERGRFSGAPAGKPAVNNADGDGVRVQFQATF